MSGFDFLDGDMITAVARLGGAPLTCKMMPVCRTWRAAIDNESERLWKEFAIARFPRLRSLLTLIDAPHSYATWYRKMLAAERPERQPISSASFDDYSQLRALRNRRIKKYAWHFAPKMLRNGACR